MDILFPVRNRMKRGSVPNDIEDIGSSKEFSAPGRIGIGSNGRVQYSVKVGRKNEKQR